MRGEIRGHERQGRASDAIHLIGDGGRFIERRIKIDGRK